MTTRQDLIDGLQMIIREGLRTTNDFAPEDWAVAVHDDEGGGWNRRQVFAHVAATGAVAPVLLGRLAQTAEGEDPGAGLDINDFNAQQVAAKEALGPAELMADLRTSYEQLIDHVRQMPEAQLDRRASFGGLRGPVSEIMQTTLVLHGLAHIYSASRRAFS